MDNITKSKIIDVLNIYSREAVPADIIKKMAMELGFESAAHSIETLEKVCKENTIKPNELPDKDLYTKMRDKLNEYNEVSLKAIQQYEDEIDSVLTDLKTMLVASGKDTKILDEVLNTKLSAI